MKRLENKVAVIYGNGTVGCAVAKTFALQGAQVFFAGRTKTKLDAVANEVKAANGKIETSVLDALDEHAIHAHFNDIVKKSGRVDISFNTIGLPQTGIQGKPLVELSLEDFFRPIASYTQSQFLTSKVAAAHMVKEGGVILMHVPNASRMSAPFVGGMIPAWAALEALCRSLSVEYGQHGVRSICLLTTGIHDTPLIAEVWDIHRHAHNVTLDQFYEIMRSHTHRKHLTTLRELTDAAVFAASDEGSAITGSIFNLTAGMIVN